MFSGVFRGYKIGTLTRNGSILTILELFTRKVSEMFVYIMQKQQNTLKSSLLFKIPEFLGLRIRNFQGVIFYEHKYIRIFSNLYWCTFNDFLCVICH